MQNTRKWIQISYLFLAGITWVFFYYLTDTTWDILGLPVPANWFIMPSQITAFVAAIVLLAVFYRNEKINQFANEVASELGKVTWPEKKETVLSAGVIALMVAICAVILFAFDSLWGTIVKIVY